MLSDWAAASIWSSRRFHGLHVPARPTGANEADAPEAFVADDSYKSMTAARTEKARQVFRSEVFMWKVAHVQGHPNGRQVACANLPIPLLSAIKPYRGVHQRSLAGRIRPWPCGCLLRELREMA